MKLTELLPLKNDTPIHSKALIMIDQFGGKRRVVLLVWGILKSCNIFFMEK